MKYRKKPIVIDAYQWYEVSPYNYGQHRDVDYFRDPNPDRGDFDLCKHCAVKFQDHGWIDTLEGGHIVCPGDFIITGVKGEKYPCKADIFKASYEEVE